MPVDLILPASIVLAIVLWTLILVWYWHPTLAGKPIGAALRPLLLLHGFRYIGMMFLINGVTSAPLDARFATPAAYGDLLAALMALVAIAAFRFRETAGIAAAWAFNIVGTIDLLNAVTQGLRFTNDGDLGAAFWIPMVIVPLLLVTHGYVFYRLVQWHKAGAGSELAAAS